MDTLGAWWFPSVVISRTHGWYAGWIVRSIGGLATVVSFLHGPSSDGGECRRVVKTFSALLCFGLIPAPYFLERSSGEIRDCLLGVISSLM